MMRTIEEQYAEDIAIARRGWHTVQLLTILIAVTARQKGSRLFGSEANTIADAEAEAIHMLEGLERELNTFGREVPKSPR